MLGMRVFNKAKYIVFEDQLSCLEEMLIFSSLLQHADVARRMGCEPIAAGFIELINGEPVCFGESISLKIESRSKIDSEVAKRLFKVVK